MAQPLAGGELPARLTSLVGLVVMMVLAWLLSDNRRRMNWRLIASGVVLQVGLAAVFLGTPLRDGLFRLAAALMAGLIACSDQGAEFVFGESFREHYFALSAMPAVIFFSSLTAVLFHLGILQWVVRLMARVMVWVMDASGTESLVAAVNVFVGMTTAPLAIRPYLDSMTRSELMAMMTAGMATAAGSTLVAYVGMAPDPQTRALLAGHLAVASLISAPAALVIAKIMVPETEESPTKGTVKIDVPRSDANLIDAACRGAAEGLGLALSIVAMIIAFIALVTMANWLLAAAVGWLDWSLWTLGVAESPQYLLSGPLGGEPLSLQRMLGWLCAPLAWVMGVPWKDAHTVGILIGEKTVFNEFIAYQGLMECKDAISPRSFIIATYALCGFANFGSIAVTIGGIGQLAPSRRADFAAYGFRAMIGGSLAAFMTAAIAGMLI